MWLGLNDIAVEGTYVWEEDGSLATWTEWTLPPISSSSDCVEMDSSLFDWDDKDCSGSEDFVCQNGSGSTLLCAIACIGGHINGLGNTYMNSDGMSSPESSL